MVEANSFACSAKGSSPGATGAASEARQLRIFVTTTTVDSAARPWATSNARRMRSAGAAYEGTDFQLTDQAADADFLLFVDSTEPYLADVLRAPLYLGSPERSFVYNHNDAAVPVVAGVYADLQGPVRHPDLHLGGFYLRCFENELLLEANDDWAPDYLFSFVGNSKNAPFVRNQILALEYPHSLLRDSTSNLKDDDPDYVATLRQSMFVLCPRGLGPTSWRFYETMMAARVPVIISDSWVPARELQWDRFALRVPERRIDSIPDLCEAYADRAREMGRLARAEWESHCSRTRAFGWVGRRLVEIGRTATRPRPGGRELLRELASRRQLLRAIRWKARQTMRRFGRVAGRQ